VVKGRLDYVIELVGTKPYDCLDDVYGIESIYVIGGLGWLTKMVID
jgi:hypothetical protein